MELPEGLRNSLKEISDSLNINMVSPYEDKLFIYKSISRDSREGIDMFFWDILQYSFYYRKFYDFETIVKIYHRYGVDIFKKDLARKLERIYNASFTGALPKYLEDRLFEMLDENNSTNV